MNNKYKTYSEFWLFYLNEHLNPKTRILHYIGTTVAIIFILVGLISSQWIYFIAAIVSGYLFAWIGHFFVEKNKPATFQYPFWSLLSDFRMYGLFIAGRLNEHLEIASQEKRKKK